MTVSVSPDMPVGPYLLRLQARATAEGKTIVQPVKIISAAVLWRIVDNGIIDGVVNGSAAVARLVGRGLGRLQSGLARAYVATIVLGALLIIGYFVIAR